MASRLSGLRCRECGTTVALGPHYVCEECFGPLEVAYDYDEIRARVSRSAIEAGPRSIWRYRDLLPIEGDGVVSLGEGCTPLVAAPRLGRELGLDRLYVKNDAVNPTYSFKDRVVSVAVSKARQLGFEAIACASTGNLAGSVAAYGAVSGLRPVIFVPADLEPSKLAGIAAYGPTLVEVDGSYDEVNRLCSEISTTRPWGFLNINLRPFYSEGSKTLAFEVVEQLGWRAPDHIVAPIASGSLLCKLDKGLTELVRVGLVATRETRISGAQPAGCAPVATAFEAGDDRIRPVKARTIAKSLAIGDPADGHDALAVIRKTGGACAAVGDDEIVEGMGLLARTEGIFTETAGGVTIAVLAKLARAGVVRRDELTVVYVTGNGYKTGEALASSLPRRTAIAPRLSAFENLGLPSGHRLPEARA